MRTFIFLAVSFFFIAFLESDVESSQKYKALQAKADSLQAVSNGQSNEMDKLLADLNDISAGMQSIREAEHILAIESQSDTKNSKSKSQITALKNDVQALSDAIAGYKEKIAKLAPGEYNIHYSAMHDSKPSVRKTAKLTVVEKPLLPSDMDLEGVIGNKLESIALPEGWGWVNPNMVIDTHTGEYEIIYTKVDFSNPVKVTVRATEKADVDTIAPTEKPSKDNTSVKTGDNALVATFAMLGTISLAGITLLKKKN